MRSRICCRRPCERRDPYRVIYRTGAMTETFRKTTAGGYGSLRSQGRRMKFKLGTIRNTSLLRMSGDCDIDPRFDLAHRPATPPRMSSNHSTKSSVAAISIFASAGMAAAKFVVGIAIGSLALISEALHSSVDLVATVITWIVVPVSDQPADAEHHYGHGKFESLSALFVIALLYVLAGGILVESWNRLREGTPPPTLSAIPFVVLVIDIAVNFWRARALHRAARATQS